MSSAIEIKSDGIIINSDEMEVNKRYAFKYKGEKYCAVKDKSGSINIYEILGVKG